jgi:plastocyanin
MRRSLLAVLIVALLVVPALPVQAAPVIRGTGTRWAPASLSVDRGTMVRWKGVSGNHHIRAYGGGWSFDRHLPVGTRVKKRFNRNGTFRFYCTIHGYLTAGTCSGMCGRVVVS